MVTEIAKNTSQEKIRTIISKKRKKKITVDSFFGKLPKLEDGLKSQKKLRDEWK